MKKWVVLYLCILLMSYGCTAATSDTKTRNIKQGKEQKHENATTTISPSGSEEKIADLTNRIEALERNFIDVRMDYISRINNLEVEIAELREGSSTFAKTSKEPRMKTEEPVEIRRVERKKGSSTKSKPDIVSGAQKVEASYDKSIELYKGGEYKEALKLLNNMVIGDTKKDVQDNIYYWKGMCRFQLNEYDAAIKDFTTVIENYPNENKYYDSKLMVGISHGMLGEKSLAINELTRLLDENIPADVREKANKSIQEFQK